MVFPHWLTNLGCYFQESVSVDHWN